MESPEWVYASVVGTLLHRFARGSVKGRVLDVGCGSKPYKRLFPDCEWVGLDKRPVGEIEGDAVEMPVEDGEFDTVLCTDLLGHVPSPAHVVMECKRVLKPGGEAVFAVRHTMPDDDETLWTFTERGLDFLLASAGFEDIRLVSDGAVFGAEWQSISLFQRGGYRIPPELGGWVDAMSERYPAVVFALATKPLT